MAFEIATKERPLMNYVLFNDKSWTTVKIKDRFAGAWCWGEGPYYDWCDEHCSDFYNIVKYSHTTIQGRFKSATDATAFLLRWS